MLRDGWMRDILARRREEGTFRELRTPEQDHCFVDFTSNDFLGLGRAADLRHAIELEAARVRQEIAERRAGSRQGSERAGKDCVTRSTASERLGLYQRNSSSSSSSNSFPDVGSGGSRLLAGNSMYAEELERWIARFHRRQAALLFNSGYDANLGLISCLPQRGDAVVCDELVHNSIMMGNRLGRQQETVMFRHNDVEHLDATLRGLRAKGSNAPTNIFVVVESVYSMDGDTAPLAEIFRVAGTHTALVIVDEAHSTGVFGDQGRGVVSALGLEAHPALLAEMHSFGKALGVHGAVVVGSATLKEFLVNYARPLIYSTSLPLHSLAGIKCAYVMQAGADGRRRRVLELADVFQRALANEDTTDGTAPLDAKDVPRHRSPIQAVLVAGNERSLFVAESLRNLGFDVRAIRKPTVQEGKERLRVTLHAFNTDLEVASLARQIRRLAGTNVGATALVDELAIQTTGKLLSTTAAAPRSVDCVARARL